MSSRERAARTFLTSLKTFAKSVKFYIESGNDVTAVDREILREKWETSFVDDEDDDDEPEMDVYGYPVVKEKELKCDEFGQPIGVTARLVKVMFRSS